MHATQAFKERAPLFCVSLDDDKECIILLTFACDHGILCTALLAPLVFENLQFFGALKRKLVLCNTFVRVSVAYILLHLVPFEVGRKLALHRCS